MSLSKWVVVLLAIMIVSAILGVVVHAVRVLAGAAFVVCLVILAVRVFSRPRPS